MHGGGEHCGRGNGRRAEVDKRFDGNQVVGTCGRRRRNGMGWRRGSVCACTQNEALRWTERASILHSKQTPQRVQQTLHNVCMG